MRVDLLDLPFVPLCVGLATSGRPDDALVAALIGLAINRLRHTTWLEDMLGEHIDRRALPAPFRLLVPPLDDPTPPATRGADWSAVFAAIWRGEEVLAGTVPEHAPTIAPGQAAAPPASPAPTAAAPSGLASDTLAALDDAPPSPDARTAADVLQHALAALPVRVAFRELEPRPASRYAVPLGIDAAGRAQWLDFAGDALHVGLYGQSGCGKDSLLRAWYAVLCRRCTPAELQCAVLDGKGDWLLAGLAQGAHMFLPPAGGYGDAGDAAILAAIAVIDQEAQRRQRLITAAGCRTREQYVATTGATLPLLLVIATDVMTSIAGAVEELLEQLVSKARSLGIRVVVSMQTPTGKSTRWRMNLSTVIAGSLQTGSQDTPALGIEAQAMRYRPSLLPPPRQRPGVFVVRSGGEQRLVQAPYLAEEAFDRLCTGLPTRAGAAVGSDDLLGDLLRSVPVSSAEKADSPAAVLVSTQDGTERFLAMETRNTTGTVLPEDDEAQMVRNLLQQYSKNQVATLLGGSKTTAYKRINRALGQGEGS